MFSKHHILLFESSFCGDLKTLYGQLLRDLLYRLFECRFSVWQCDNDNWK